MSGRELPLPTSARAWIVLVPPDVSRRGHRRSCVAGGSGCPSKVTFEMGAVMSVWAWPELRQAHLLGRNHGVPVRAPAEGQETRLR